MVKVNGEEHNYYLFPNNELKVAPIRYGNYVEIKDGDDIEVELIYENSIDIVHLIFVKKFLDETYPHSCVDLVMKYIPYSRMDRTTPFQMFTCKYLCQLINDLCFSSVTVLDPHSNVCVGALERVKQIDLSYYVKQVLDYERVKEGTYIDAIFLPDVGAYKKYTEVLDNIKLPKFWGNKHRDLDNGAITDYDIIGDIDVNGKNILIVDDICVKGFTTLFASKKLKELGAKKVVFYCSHCEDAIHSGQLLKTDYVDRIYTTDSMKFDEHNKIIKLY